MAIYKKCKSKRDKLRTHHLMMAADLTNCLSYSEANLKTIHDLDSFNTKIKW